MKKIFTLLIVMMFSVAALFAQAPEKFSYQAVVRNSNNTLVSNAPVGVRVSILSGGASGNIVYSETHTTATNANGLLTIEIGSGSVQQGVFSDIAWGEGMLFLKTEIDPTSGSNYSITSVQQLLSVPYALYAKEAANSFSGDYNDLSNKPQIPTVPTNVSAFTNDAGYITNNDIPAIPTVPTNVSAFTNDAGYITGYTETDPQFNAWDKDYNDLINKPTIPTVPDSVSAFVNDAGYLTSYTEQQVLSISNDTIFLTGGSFVKLPAAAVGFSGDYNDLINKPQIPTVPTNVSAFSNDAGYLTSFTEQQILSISNDTIFLTGGSFVKLPAGFDGDYNSLTNKPVIPTVPTSLSAFVNDMGYITAIPDSLGGISIESDPIFSAWDKDYNDLINTPEIPTVPTNVSSFTNDAGYVTANQLSSANYITAEDIPAQVNADWNATEGAAQILNKPSLFSGDYNDLTNKPQIPTVPTNVSAFSNDAGYITMDSIPDIPTVPTNLSAFVNDVGYITAIPDSLGGISIESDPIFSAWDKDYNDLINTPEIPTVPTNVSAFTNDAGYITMDSIPTIPVVPANVSAFTNDAGYLTSFTEQQILSISNDTIFLTGGSFVKLPAGFDGDYNSLTNKPAIPTIPDSVSAFVNDAGYITNADLPEIPTIPTNVSAFNNDAGYITNNNSDCLNSVDLCDLQNRIDELDSLINLFNELPSTPTVLTTGVTAITTTSFTVTGEVVLEGGSNVTERGFVYGLTNNPTISDSKTTNGSGLGSFTATISGLQAGYTYYVRAYATNQNGTAYGSQMTVTTNTISPSTLPSVNTISVTNIGNNEATVTASVTSDGGENVTQRGFVYDTLSNPTTSSMVAYHGTGVGQFSNLLSGLLSGKTYYVRAFATNSVGTAYGNEISFTTNVPSPVAGDAIPCPNTPTVTDHEGNVYNTVKIGTQCWTKENLRTTTSPSTGTYLIPPAGTINTFTGKQARWYDNDSATYAPKNYGLLYNWNAVVDTFDTELGELSVNPLSGYFNAVFSGYRRGICPQGWHVPSDEEWAQLTDYLNSHEEYLSGGINEYNAKALASTNDWLDCSSAYSVGNNLGENNLTGFSAVPAGNWFVDFSFYDVDRYAIWWSSTERDQENAWYISFYSHSSNAYIGPGRKDAAASVRCLRDMPCSNEIDTTGGGVDTTTTVDTNATFVFSGALSGLFSISATKQVRFSKGNLQYQASSNTWRFAENQWDIIGSANSNVSSSYNGWIDLFGWGTSGYNNKYPWMTSETDSDYGDSQNSIAYTNYDWGQYNPISNGGNQAGLWRTLSSAELNYMVYGRANAENLYSMGVVNGWHGLIILPDSCTLPDNISFTPAYKQFTNDVNNFTLGQWRQMEAVGAVFLPVAGERNGTTVSQVNESGYYWSTDGAREMWFGRMYIYYNPGIGGAASRHNGFSVRLVTDSIFAASIPSDTNSSTPFDTNNYSSTQGYPCPGTPTVTDIDGNTYNTVQIGQQCWMKENLRTTRFSDGIEIAIGTTRSDNVPYRSAPDGNDNNVLSYGYLYNWAAAMHGSSSSNANPSNIQGVCPTGWHLPSYSEWLQLTNYIYGHNEMLCADSAAAKALAAPSGWIESSIVENNSCVVRINAYQNNVSGFSAMPAGNFFDVNTYAWFGTLADFWSSTQLYSNTARCFAIDKNDTDPNYNASDYKYVGISVRCLRD